MLESKCDSIVMQVYCKKSCGICKPSECLDKNPTTCGVLKSMGMCSLPEFVRNCPVSCQKCGMDVVKTPKGKAFYLYKDGNVFLKIQFVP